MSIRVEKKKRAYDPSKPPLTDAQRAARVSYSRSLTLQKPQRLSRTDRDEMHRLADEAVAAGNVTKLAPGFAAGSTGMIWERLQLVSAVRMK